VDQCGRGTESGRRRSATPVAATVTVLREVIELMASGDQAVPLDELRRHLSRAQRDLARIRARGGAYRAIQFSPHTIPLQDLLTARRKAG
jgi:hypothetical protein